MRVEFKGGETGLVERPVAIHPHRARGVGDRLAEALRDLAQGYGELCEHRQRPWASITFSGVRHELHLRFAGFEAVAAGERLIAEVVDHEFTIPRQLVADVTVVAVDQLVLPEPSLAVRLEILTLEEG